MARARVPPWSVGLLGLAPAAVLALGAVGDRLGANPVEALLHDTGQWGLRFLLASLAMTPLRRLGLRAASRYRRVLGLLAFGYALGHFSVYVAFEVGFDGAALVEDVVERPFVTAGFAALTILTPLALTSTRAAQRRLGRRWRTLHRSVYVALGAALLHVVWGAKADLREPLVYVALGALLLAARWPPRSAGTAASRARAEDGR